MPSRSSMERGLVLAIAGLMTAQMLVVAERGSRPETTSPAAPRAVPLAEPPTLTTPDPAPSAATVTPPGSPAPPSDASDDVVHTGSTAATAEPGSTTPDAGAPGGDGRADAPVTAAAATDPGPPADPARARFEERFPAHAAATQDPGDPATAHWAVVVGINEHQGGVRDNVASRQDGQDLVAHLHGLGWRDDHVLLLTDVTATGETIEQALRWLARKTDDGSTVVVHYSGHTKQTSGDVDGDGEDLDESLWPADSRFITDRRFVALLDGVRGRLWVNIAACEAEGLGDPGIARPGRVLTFSSSEHEKSYEDPSVGNSVWGFFMIEEGLRAGFGDGDRNGDVTVQEAFEFAAPRAARRTSRQSQGAQHPVMVDQVPEGFSLRIAPPAAPEDEPSPSPSPCQLPVCFDDRRR